MKVWTWAFIRPDGRVLADSDFRDEDQAWTIGLGWPGPEELARAKLRGYRVARVEVHIPKREAPALPDLGNPLQYECYMDALRAEAEKP